MGTVVRTGMSLGTCDHAQAFAASYYHNRLFNHGRHLLFFFIWDLLCAFSEEVYRESSIFNSDKFFAAQTAVLLLLDM